MIAYYKLKVKKNEAKLGLKMVVGSKGGYKL
jgi:hypothetical protein